MLYQILYKFFDTNESYKYEWGEGRKVFDYFYKIREYFEEQNMCHGNQENVSWLDFIMFWWVSIYIDSIPISTTL